MLNNSDKKSFQARIPDECICWKLFSVIVFFILRSALFACEFCFIMLSPKYRPLTLKGILSIFEKAEKIMR